MSEAEELLNRAMAAYFRRASADGALHQQPDARASGVRDHEGKRYVVLVNAVGTMAVYRVRNDGMLKGMKRWPAEVAEPTTSAKN